jgi:nucleotide-binding universal stress UspA family protein
MLKSIIVALDGSPLAERTLPFAARLGHSSGARLTLVRAVFTASAGFATTASAMRIAAARVLTMIHQAEAEMAEAVEALRKDGIEVETRARGGSPALVILEEAANRQADLILMGTHGRSGPKRFLSGSVADEVLRKSRIPVLLVGPASTDDWPTDRPLHIIAALDGSALAEAALGPAVRLSETLAGDLLLLRAVDTDSEVSDAARYLESVGARLWGQGRVPHTRAVIGSAISVITEAAGDWPADVIAMATHGRSGLAQLVMGSVTTATLRAARVPLLVVRPPAMGHSEESQSHHQSRQQLPREMREETRGEHSGAVSGRASVAPRP